MDTKINRLEKTTDRQGNPEVFVEVIFDTEKYGKLPFGKWIQKPDSHNMTEEQIISFMDNFKDTAIRLKDEELVSVNELVDEE